MKKFGNRVDKYTAYLIDEYYKLNIKPFMAAVDEDVLWVGPYNGQVIRTKVALVSAFENEKSQLKFETGPITSMLFNIGRKHCDVLAFLDVTTFFPDGKTMTTHQRYHVTWIKKDDEWKIQILTISNSMSFDSRDTIFPDHLLESVAVSQASSGSSKRISVKEKGSALMHYINISSILYVESRGHDVDIHLLDSVISISSSLQTLENEAEGSLLRCHASFLVNPGYVKSISRFQLTMHNGDIIPIPEKKYTSIKKQLMNINIKNR